MLLNVIPTPAEADVIKSYDGDRAMLAATDSFFLDVVAVPAYQERLKAMKFFQHFGKYVEEIESKFLLLETVLLDIHNNRKLRVFFKYALAVGNHLNGESAKGGAFGFKLDTLDQIMSMRSADNSSTLLSYIVRLIETKEGVSYIDPNENFNNLQTASQLPIQGLKELIDKLIGDLQNIDIAIGSQTYHPKDRVKILYSGKRQEVSDQITLFQDRLLGLEKLYAGVCRYYFEDSFKVSSDKFCERFYMFWNACKETETCI
jgi:diaphanous 1